jgi:hypothetical protein
MTIAPLDTDLLRQHIESLMTASRASNLFYHSMLIRPGTSLPSAHVEFDEEIVDITNEIIISYHNGNADFVAIRPHLQALLLQLHLEGKTFLAILRNLTTISTPGWRRKTHWNPWSKSHGEINAAGQPTSGAIIKNILKDLDPAHGQLADQFDHCFGKQTTQIRHAIAHATFRRPSAKNDEMWTFAEFELPANGGFASLKRTTVSPQHVDQILENVLNFKWVFWACCDKERQHLLELDYAGECENQMAPAERIKFRLTPEHVEFTAPPTPPFPGWVYRTK